MSAEKRTRVEESRKAGGSRLFSPYRALGYVTSNVGHSIQHLGQTAFITTAIGRSYHVYNLEKLRLAFVGPQFDSDIVSILSIGEETFVSSGGHVHVCRRGKISGELEYVDRGEITHLMAFGRHILGLSSDNALVVWDKDTHEVFTEIEFERSEFQVTAVVHPSTYVNKVVVGSAQGTLQVWNIQTRRCLHEVKSLGAGIGCLAQAPAIDILAVGLLDGRIQLHNVRTDRSVMQLAQEGRVTALSFRTDDVPMMASANGDGDVALWDLDSRRLVHVMQNAHDGPVPSLDFVAGQPLLVTSSGDNSIKQWLFDGQDGVPRQLRQRSGHFAAPHMIRYYDQEGRSLLSAGRDRTLRFFSVIRDEQNTELSQGSLAREARARKARMSELRFPAITQFAASHGRERDWDNVLTSHQGVKAAFTWSVDRKALGKFTIASADDSVVRAVAVSSCGNFGFLGHASGLIEMVNMQSGYARRSFTGHSKAVTGIACDPCNQHVFSTSLDGSLRMWDFGTGQELWRLDLPSVPTRLELHGESGLLACVCDDACVRVVDAESQRIVRRFAGHRNRITDLTFSSDGRWIVTCSLDSTIRTWDLPTGHMVDWFRVASVPVSVAFSPSGDFLASAHMDSVGIFLWANRTQFADVTLRQIRPDEADQAAMVAMPTTSGLADDESPDDSLEVSAGVYLTPEQLTDNMVTLSSQPKAKWQTLLNLATIKKRNRPTEAPKQPEQAPFFLPTVEGVEHRFDLEAANDAGQAEPQSRTGISTANVQSKLAVALARAAETGVYAPVFDYLKTLNPAAADLEIRTLPLDDGLVAIKTFLRMMQAQLQSKRDFELAQAYLHVFLGVFGDVLKANASEVADVLGDLRSEGKAQWGAVDQLIRYSACMVDYMRSAK